MDSFSVLVKCLRVEDRATGPMTLPPGTKDKRVGGQGQDSYGRQLHLTLAIPLTEL